MARSRTDTDEVVLTLLKGAPTPMSAYQVLDRLRPEGIQSPPIVYRALERLEKAGQIHRLEGLNAYFACCGRDHHTVGTVFAVCTGCRRVEEWSCEGIDDLLGGAAAKAGFAPVGRIVEVRGLCAICRGAARPEDAHGLTAHGPGCECGHGSEG
ncbi:transcriptional repressor [Siculibacillus lacustris]|uniref:Transcriptional repressor n=1 Tax=Siculibacillus lacustris TaxID=1549641 RepID=A0A4Q9VQT1_9HYPH|nr:transcriptional repressor [Siculibacillus lacustris]TBW38202.1 transcriptional repressor [Siculibacillus lacustris]